jgi:Xaa-Pro aminopeptidase
MTHPRTQGIFPPFRSRLNHLRAQFALLKVDSFLVTFPPHLRYLSGFSGSTGAGLITAGGATLLTDGRYADQVKSEVRQWRIAICPDGVLEEIKRRRLLQPGQRVGFDGNTLTYAQYSLFKKTFPKAVFCPKVDCIEKIAVVKDEHEIANIRKAVEITDRVFSDILGIIKPGIREQDISAEISYRQRKYGAEGDAFETIVASGERGALPHGRASMKKIASRELVTLDFGCVYGGYHSDMTRTVAVGRPHPEAKKIYYTVLDAQLRAIEAARSGVKTGDLDAIARGFIRKEGYDRYFRHSLGHGLGLQIHEPPRISVLSTSTLQAGNVVTIEPGVYIAGLGGVRIEDDVVIRADHCDVLNRSPKELIVL